MFQIKICGITSVEDASDLVSAGADAIGLNFCRESPRYVTPELAAQIAEALPASIAKVGVFVNEEASIACQLFDALALKWIQLHGDEGPEYLDALGGRPTIRAMRLGSDGVSETEVFVAECRRTARRLDAVLVDARVEGIYGGSGNQVDPQMLSMPRPWLGGMPLILAGGLSPENVAEVIAKVRPDAVDTASGVETAPGRKDADQMVRFVRAARTAFGS